MISVLEILVEILYSDNNRCCPLQILQLPARGPSLRVSCQPAVLTAENSTSLFELRLHHGAAERRLRVVKPQPTA